MKYCMLAFLVAGNLLADGVQGRKIGKLVLGGRRGSGDRDAANGGGYLIGPGSLTSPKPGLLMLVR